MSGLAKPKLVKRKGDARLTEPVCFRMSTGELDALHRHAIRRGEFATDVIRRAVALLLLTEPAGE